ncbi:MAG: HEAT repeat domain-containing protein, partial [Isosphaeraceae bacterium]|nr:HEAT repeat domain-containing protein [Isosphaeraceae bacterium]
MPRANLRRVFPALGLVILSWVAATNARAALPKVPDGFEVRLVATVPAVLYPCQVATSPDGSLFVAEDPMDQVGPYEAKHGRILRFQDGKDPLPFAEGFRAIQGMAWHDGALYVSHMPFLSVLRDTDGDGKVDSRKDLFKDLGPTNNQGLNDHIVSGIQFGMDGYLYISVGDKGVPKATGPDGRTAQIIGGGTLRCRPDGTGLEVFSTGTRNHLEANLDDRDNLFTYDNTDDGGGWWTRVTHHVDGGYYGYPYDYHPRPDRMLPRMAEYGGGSPCGAVVYKEDAWPEKYRNVGLWAEWGKGKVHAFRFAPDGSTFKVESAIDFALPSDVANFRPIDLAVSYDGRTLYVADWGMGGWGKQDEKVGRIFAITYKGTVKTRPRGNDADSVEAQIKQLDHLSFNERTRAQAALIKRGEAALGAATAALADPKTDAVAKRHLVWAIDGIAGGSPEATMPLLDALRSPISDVRAQAARALGERQVPIAVEPLVKLLADAEPAVRLQAVIALGRIGDEHAVRSLVPHVAEPDVFIAFSTRQALRRIGAWRELGGGLASTDSKVRAGVLSTLELVYQKEAVEALAGYAADARHPADERARAVRYVSQVHRRARPWDGHWWGTRPVMGKPPAKVDEWAGTPVVLAAVRAHLSDPQVAVRIAAVEAVTETNDRTSLPALRAQFLKEGDTAARVAIAKSLGALDDKASLKLLISVMRDANAPEAVRDAALASVEVIGSDVAVAGLLEALGEGLPVERQPRVIGALGRFKAKAAVPAVVRLLASPTPAVRTASAEALGKIGELKGVDQPLRALLDDRVLDVRKKAIEALGALKDREAVPALVKAAQVDETRFEASMALAELPDLSGLQVYLRGLTDKNQELRKASAAALGQIRDLAAPVLDQLASRRELAPSAVTELHKVYTSLRSLTSWRVLGPFPMKETLHLPPDGAVDQSATHTGLEGRSVVWKQVDVNPKDGQIDFGRVYSNGDNVAAFAYSELQSDADRVAQFVVGSDDTLTVWLNGKQVYDFQDHRGFDPQQARFDVNLVKGKNRVLVKCGNYSGG